MARIDGVSTRNAGPLVRAIYAITKRRLGKLVEPVTVYAHTPGLLVGYGMLEQATGKQHAVPQRVKALAELKAAALVNCEFCCDIGSSLAREAGITEEEILALPNYRDSDRFDAREKLVLDYACAMSRTPTSVTDELFAQMHKHFNARQLVELTNAIALENMRGRFNSAFDMAPGGFSEGMVCVQPEGAEQAPAAEGRACTAFL